MCSIQSVFLSLVFCLSVLCSKAYCCRYNLPTKVRGKPLPHLSCPDKKSGLTCPRTKGHENDRTVNWCKHICCFPNPLTTDPEYKEWRDAVCHRMQQDGIPSQALATPKQWTAIQVYGLSLEPLTSNGRAAIWQQDTNSGLRFTECSDYLFSDIAKKHSKTFGPLGCCSSAGCPCCSCLGRK